MKTAGSLKWLIIALAAILAALVGASLQPIVQAVQAKTDEDRAIPETISAADYHTCGVKGDGTLVSPGRSRERSAPMSCPRSAIGMLTCSSLFIGCVMICDVSNLAPSACVKGVSSSSLDCQMTACAPRFSCAYVSQASPVRRRFSASSSPIVWRVIVCPPSCIHRRSSPSLSSILPQKVHMVPKEWANPQ